MEFTLNSGAAIPAVGLGTWRSTGEAVYKAVLHALGCGYTHIDDAAIYGNEKEVGRAVADSGLPREKIFLTTKVWNDASTRREARSSIEESLSRLGTDYADMVLIHWPGEYSRNAEVYAGMEDPLREGKTRSIGVSNFPIHHIDALLKTAEIVPAVDQVECHVTVQNHRLQRYCAEKTIRLQAYGPLMSDKVATLIENETLIAVGEKYGRSPAQVALRWLLERGIIALPKSVTPRRIEANIDVFDFSLDDDDMRRIRHLNTGAKVFPDPDNIDYGFPVDD